MESSSEVIDGIKCYAPELAFENEDYPVNDFEYLYKVEDTNFWFKSRNRILIHVFNKYLTHLPVAQILEIGCGTGYVLKGLADFPKFRLNGADIYLEGLKYAKKRVPASQFIQLDATRLPFEAEFDVVGAFDTLEHIEQDLTVMQNIYKALKPAGFFFISVPQHRFMWSEVDVRSFHKRRYSRKELLEKLEQAGFKVVYTTSFVFTLFPAILASRLLKRKRVAQQEAGVVDTSEFDLPVFLNRLFELLMKVDEWFIKRAVSLPFGSSLLIVAQKNK